MSDTEHPPNLYIEDGTLLTMPEVAKILRISPRTLRRYLHDGTIPGHLYARQGGRPRGAVLFTPGAVREIAENLWSAPRPEDETQPPIPRQYTPGMVPYRPRRRLS